jgi:predicted transcriptional regulator
MLLTSWLNDDGISQICILNKRTFVGSVEGAIVRRGSERWEEAQQSPPKAGAAKR